MPEPLAATQSLHWTRWLYFPLIWLLNRDIQTTTTTKTEKEIEDKCFAVALSVLIFYVRRTQMDSKQYKQQRLLPFIHNCILLLLLLSDRVQVPNDTLPFPNTFPVQRQIIVQKERYNNNNKTESNSIHFREAIHEEQENHITYNKKRFNTMYEMF